ncbi:MAG: glycosyltransferase family 1 protein [Desulfobacterales bacterium]|nr:glycosyltransferase family 1 protein [Desulfobacterales bacterium]
MNITILTIGTWGDVIPYIALSHGLIKAGNNVKIAAPINFETAIKKHNIAYEPIGFDFQEYLNSKDCKDALSGNFFAMIRHQKNFLNRRKEMLDDAWKAAQDSDVIIYNPLFSPAYHIAEKLNILAIMVSVSPWLAPTSEFPYLFIATSSLGSFLNRFSYNAYHLATDAEQKYIAPWCEQTLKIKAPKRFMNYLYRGNSPVPILYLYSPNLVPIPSDWSEDICVSGYWSLDQKEIWEPPESLENFLKAGEPPVYVGFGSILSSDPKYLTNVVVDALKQSGERGIVATGWGAMNEIEKSTDSIYFIDSVPHEWLFPRMKAIVHHGGAGTTCTGLRYGKPTLACPMTTDHWFWANRICKLGVGPPYISQWPWKKMKACELSAAIKTLVTDKKMKTKAEELGNKLSKEDGISNAVDFIIRQKEKWDKKGEIFC